MSPSVSIGTMARIGIAGVFGTLSAAHVALFYACLTPELACPLNIGSPVAPLLNAYDYYLGNLLLPYYPTYSRSLYPHSYDPMGPLLYQSELLQLHLLIVVAAGATIALFVRSRRRERHRRWMEQEALDGVATEPQVASDRASPQANGKPAFDLVVVIASWLIPGLLLAVLGNALYDWLKAL